MSADLFVHKIVPTFDESAATSKAASAQMDEDPTSWPRQIMTELFRCCPETSDYTPRVSMMKTDPEQGYGLGVVVIENNTDSALAATRSGPSSKKILVPVVIKAHTLCPLDLIMLRSGRMLPLNAHSLREALFRPETFEMTTEDYGDTGLYNQFYPPGRSDNDFGAGISQGIGGGTQGAVTVMQGPGMKFSAATEFALLRELAPTLLAPDLAELTDKVATLQIEPGTSFFGALQLLVEAEKGALTEAGSLVKRAAATAPADVIQMGWDGHTETYWVKRASRSAYVPAKTVSMTRKEALKVAGTDVVRKIDTDGVVTLLSGVGKTAEASPENWEMITKSGIYKVRSVHGKDMTGWVLTNLMDLDGVQAPMCVFTNGAAAMVQDEIAGVHAGAPVDLPSSSPRGTGCFYCAGPDGVQATVPLLIQGSSVGDDGEGYLAKSLTGEETRVRLVPGIKTMVALKGEFHVPSSARFLPLTDELMVALVDSVSAATKTAADLGTPTITLFGGDDRDVSIRFQAMPKLASVTPKRLSREDAAFVLCLSGADPAFAYSKLASASSGDTVSVSGMRDVRLASDILEQTRKIASSRSHEVRALRQSLVKEAAQLPDAMTVDAVLSLGFINSENVRMYISSIPYLEKCLSKVCELVLGSRIGLTEIPEYASARAARALDDVIQGLKALALRDVQEGASAGR